MLTSDILKCWLFLHHQYFLLLLYELRDDNSFVDTEASRLLKQSRPDDLCYYRRISVGSVETPMSIVVKYGAFKLVLNFV